jgi:hypothetical protein
MAALAGVALFLAGAAPLPAMAQSGWEQDLAAELELAEQCAVSYLSHVVERTIDGRQVVMAKAHCEDGRVFDALRPDELEPFRLSACEPATGTQGC